MKKRDIVRELARNGLFLALCAVIIGVGIGVHWYTLRLMAPRPPIELQQVSVNEARGLDHLDSQAPMTEKRALLESLGVATLDFGSAQRVGDIARPLPDSAIEHMWSLLKYYSHLVRDAEGHVWFVMYPLFVLAALVLLPKVGRQRREAVIFLVPVVNAYMGFKVVWELACLLEARYSPAARVPLAPNGSVAG